MDIADEVFQSITDPESEDMAVSFSIGLPPLLLRSGGNTYTYVGISLGCMAASASYENVTLFGRGDGLLPTVQEEWGMAIASAKNDKCNRIHLNKLEEMLGIQVKKARAV